MISSGIDGSYLIVAVDETYVQFLTTGESYDQWLYCEAISNQFLSVGQKLESEQITALMLLGFEETPDSPNYYRVFKVCDTGTLTDIATLILQIFATIYLCSSDSEVDIDLHIEQDLPMIQSHVPEISQESM